jgi:hypothetical protein
MNRAVIGNSDFDPLRGSAMRDTLAASNAGVAA